MKYRLISAVAISTLLMSSMVFASSEVVEPTEEVVVETTEEVVVVEELPEGITTSEEITMEDVTFSYEPTTIEDIEGQNIENPELYNSEVRLDNVQLRDAYGNQIETFSTTPTMPWYKVWVNNTSNYNYTVNIRKYTGMGTIVGTFSVPAHTQKYYQGDTGKVAEVVAIEVMQPQSYPLSGTVSAKIGTDVASLG